MSHLSRDELVRWRDEGLASDRERVVGHLAACDACGAAYAELVWTAPPDEGAAPPAEAAFRARGYAIARPHRGRPLVLARPLLLAAGLGAVAVAGGLLMTGGPRGPRDPGIRGSQLQPLAPVGAVSAPIEFRWASPIQAARFRLDVTDAWGNPVAVLPAERDRASDPSLTARLLPGERYLWTVTALDAEGVSLLRSPPRAFTLSARGE